jgi:uncharacterized protein
MERISFTLGGLLIGLGIAFAGFSIGNAIFKSRLAERTVSVKGLAEKEVDADLAIWPITFKETGNDLSLLQKSIDTKREVITQFLESSGFARPEISYSASKINDTQAEMYANPTARPNFRYVAQATVTLRSNNVAGVKKTIENSGALITKGIGLAENWENRTQFLFTGLNAIKPEMIETATKSAREAAEKFAKDSESKVGKIRSASQGLFEITDRDPNSPDRKKVRVVTKVDYYLVDQ